MNAPYAAYPLDNQLLQHGPRIPIAMAAPIQRRARLGGLLSFYHRQTS